MDLNFHAFEGKNIYKFSKYKIIEINKTKYIAPADNAKSSAVVDLESSYSESVLIDFMNIGKSAIYKESDLEEKVIEFINKYSTLGLINDFPINKYFFLDEKIVLKDYNYIENSDMTTIIDRKEYFKLFFPTYTDKQIEKLIKDATKLAEESAMEKYITSDINKLITGSDAYYEPLDMFIQYAVYLYNLLNYSSLNDEINTTELLKQFSANNIKMNLTQNGTFSVEFQVTCLKQYLDYYFAKTVSKEINLLKICKFCNKAFLANNPKAEYDTPQCKNKANVYKSRAKNK